MPFRRILFCVAAVLALSISPARAGLLDAILPEEGATIGFVPKTADNIGKQLDEQLMRILEPSEMTREQVSIACTVPVWLDNLKRTSPLARQMSEELARYFKERGYRLEELRKGDEVLMTPERGEFLLTRDTKKLVSRDVNAHAVLVGTYTVTERSVRFNMRLIHTSTREVLAAASGTVPVTEELLPLLRDASNAQPLGPTVRTKLPRN